MCTGLETRLFDCSNPGIEVEDCGHSEDAGVVCVVGMYPTIWQLHLQGVVHVHNYNSRLYGRRGSIGRWH